MQKKNSLYLVAALMLMAGQTYGTKTAPVDKAPNSLVQMAEDLEIDSDSGVTCEKDGSRCSASGKIRVKQGPWVMNCSKLDVTFQKNEQGMQQVHGIEASGKVHITQQEAGYDITAGRATYVHGTQVMDLYERPILTQKDMKLVNSNHVQVRYQEGQATATGRPTVLKDDKILQANTLILFFVPGQDASKAGGPKTKGSTLDHLDAEGNVIVSGPQEIATGNKGRYVHGTQVAELEGNVTLTQCNKAIQGDRAVFDLANGQSQMMYAKGSTHRVQAILTPDK